MPSNLNNSQMIRLRSFNRLIKTQFKSTMMTSILGMISSLKILMLRNRLSPFISKMIQKMPNIQICWSMSWMTRISASNKISVQKFLRVWTIQRKTHWFMLIKMPRLRVSKRTKIKMTLHYSHWLSISPAPHFSETSKVSSVNLGKKIRKSKQSRHLISSGEWILIDTLRRRRKIVVSWKSW